MSDPEDKSPQRDNTSDDGQHIISAQDVDSDIPQLEEQETDDGTELQDTSHRRGLQEKPESASEVSSIDASLVDSLPRRVGSPVESVASGRGDSIQVS